MESQNERETPFKHTPVEARKLWADALLSGEFQQGQVRLCRVSNGRPFHCCLGVACRVFSHHESPIETEEFEDSIKFDGRACDLPQAVERWLGLRPYDATDAAFQEGIPKSLMQRRYIQMNDIENKSFAEIADVILSTVNP
jgi:hypothetical protein